MRGQLRANSDLMGMEESTCQSRTTPSHTNRNLKMNDRTPQGVKQTRKVQDVCCPLLEISCVVLYTEHNHSRPSSPELFLAMP